MDDFVDELKFSDLALLLSKIGEKKWFRKIEPWSERGQNKYKQKLMTGFAKLLHGVAGGEPAELVLDLIKRAEFKHVIMPVPDEEDTPDDLRNLLNNLRVVFHAFESTNHHADAFRFHILQSMVGVRGIKLLRKEGWRIQEDTWSRVLQSVQLSDQAKQHYRKRGPVTFQVQQVKQDPGGRPPISDEAKQTIRDMTMDPEHSRKVAGSFKKTNNPMCLTSTTSTIKRKLSETGLQVSHHTLSKYMKTEVP